VTSEEFMLLFLAVGSFTVCAAMKTKYIKWIPYNTSSYSVPH
jgi:hypothetical protein